MFRLDDVVYIGDDPRDCTAAYNAGCKSIFLGVETEVRDLPDRELPIMVSKRLSESIGVITDFYE